MNDHDHLTALLGRLKLTALRDQLDSLIDQVKELDVEKLKAEAAAENL